MDSCKQITRLASDRLDRPLSPGERLRLRLHLLICRGCHNYDRQIRLIHRAALHLSGREDER